MSKDVNAADSDWNRNTADVLSIICLDGRVEYRWGVDNKPTKYPNASQGLEYTLNSDGKSYSVTGIGTCTDKNLIIPSTYNGKPVTEIAESAFYNEYQAGNSILGTSEYSKYTFTSVTIPSSVTKINEFAFYNCRLITKIVLSDGVTTIGDHAFVFCGITKIDIPKSVVNLGKGVFGSCDLLEEIAVDVNNPKYKSIDGNLYSADGQILVMYASGKSQNSFTIPSHVKTVGYHSFTYCNNLVEIVIPNTVTIIDDYAIVDCNYLANLYIGNGVKTLGVGIIYSLYTNVKITYSGSIDEWKKIEKRTDEFGYDWNSFLQIPAIYCSNGVYYVE